MKKLYLVFAAAAMLIFSVGAFAAVPQDNQQPSQHSGTGHGQGEGHGQGMMTPQAMLDHMTQELNLTDDQQTKIKPIIEEHFKQMQQVRQDTAMSREDRHAKMKEIHESMISEAKPILNSDQQKKLDEMASRHSENGEKGRHNGDHDSSSQPK